MSAVMESPAVDLVEASRFLDIMAEGEPVTFQTFDDDADRKLPELANVLHGDLAAHAPRLQMFNARGAGVFWTVNFTDGAGRKAENVTSVRAFFLDLDGAALQPVLAAGVEPHAVIASSPGKWHCYWLVNGCKLEQFKAVQTALAAKFNGDPSVNDLPRVMRMPGFLHRKGEPFATRVESMTPMQPYEFDDLVQRLGLDITAPPPGADLPDPSAREFATPQQIAELRSALNALNPDHRATWVACGHRLKGLGPAGRELWVSWSQQSEKWKPEDARQWATFKPEHTGYRAIFAAAQAAGWGNPASGAAIAAGMMAGAAGELVQSFDRFIGARKPVAWAVQNMIQRGYIYSLTARWGGGKTAVALPLGMHVAGGLTWAGFKVAQTRVLYLAGENPDDVRLRALQAARVFDMDAAELAANMSFTTRSLNLTAEQQAVALLDRVAAEGFGLVIVDTGAAHSDMEEESNAEMHALAMALRRLSLGLAGAAVVCLMHPPHSATRDTLRARGGGAFAAEIDGELLLWKDDGSNRAELFHSSKLRGPGFASVFFELERHEVEGMVDNFGDPVSTVVAVPAATTTGPRVQRETPAQRKALETLMLAARERLAHDDDGRMRGVHVEDWRTTFYSQSTADTQDAKRQGFHRVRSNLQAAGLVRVEDDFYLPTDTGRLAALALTPRTLRDLPDGSVTA